VAKGGSSSVIVPLGSRIDATAPSGFTTCLAGTKGSPTPDELCEECPTGTSSTPGATTCQACDKGKFNGISGGTCHNCLKETFQDQNTKPSTSCVACPTGWQQSNEGSSTCLSLNWKTPSSCKDTQYLNNTAMAASLWECQPCPKGKLFLPMYSFQIVLFLTTSFSLLQVVIALAQSYPTPFDPNSGGGKYLWKKEQQP
jgi:hypothetical protein